MSETIQRPDDKLMDRIRKIHAKAESLKQMGPAYEQEALTFATQAQKMLTMYKLSLTDLEMSKLDTQDPLEHTYVHTGEKLTKAWVTDLAGTVAKAHYCKILLGYKASIIIVGRRTDREVAEFVFSMLLRHASTQSDKEARTFRKNLRREVGSTTGNNRDFRTAWLIAFVVRVKERYAAESENIKIEAAKTGTSLIRLENSFVQVDDYMRKTWPKLGRAKVSVAKSANAAGFAAGRAAGDKVNIRGTGIGGSPSTQRTLR